MTTKLLYLFTRTPLHVGAGASVGAIDQPIQRERHTGFPIIPGSSLKGSFADQWPLTLRNEKGTLVRVTSKVEDKKYVVDELDLSGAAFLFGSDDSHLSFAGALIFSEARLLAFPIRSAKGSYAWITCPLILQRAARDEVFTSDALKDIENLTDTAAFFKKNGPLAIDEQIVLEDYCFNHNDDTSEKLANAFSSLVSDKLFESIADRLVILSNGMMSYFVTTACEIAQHVRINDETGTAEAGALFNQENVPADTLFYSLITTTDSRVPHADFKDHSAKQAWETFSKKVKAQKVFQFGGNATTGLGFTSVTIQD